MKDSTFEQFLDVGQRRSFYSLEFGSANGAQCGLTFDLSGLPKAGPLEGGVRRRRHDDYFGDP